MYIYIYIYIYVYTDTYTYIHIYIPKFIGGAGNTTPIAFGGGDPVVGDTWVSEFGSDNSM